MSTHCLNCNAELQGSFCHRCGQKSSTHRITFSKFIQHDLMHGVFHLDKGILYTLKTLLYSPGYAAKSFISGKRVVHYNIFALFIIIIALKTLVDLQQSPGEVFASTEARNRHSDEVINETIHHYYKFIYLMIIPLLSLFSSLLLRKLKYNFVEHIVFNCFLLAGGFFYALLFSLLNFLANMYGLQFYAMPIIAAYLLLGYYQGTRGTYSFFDYLWRGLSIIILFGLSLFAVLMAIIVVFYNGNFSGHILF